MVRCDREFKLRGGSSGDLKLLRDVNIDVINGLTMFRIEVEILLERMDFKLVFGTCEIDVSSLVAWSTQPVQLGGAFSNGLWFIIFFGAVEKHSNLARSP